MSKYVIYVFAIFVICSQIPFAEARDPFAPAVSSTIRPKENTNRLVPDEPGVESSNIIALDKYLLATYKLIGVLASPDKQIAVVRGPDRKDYFVTVGDVIGKEKGTIKEINVEHMLVSVNNKDITLVVSNRNAVVEGQKNGQNVQ